ncbi:MAG: hypothetical protein NC415_12470 [bacterium]|nr:hypothetical protein [bacterium]
MELPEKTERVETASWVGNSGNGNHTDIWAGMVICSELPAEEIEEFFADYMVAELPAETDVEEYLAQEYNLELGTVTHEIEGLFSTLQESISEDGCFLISRYYEAFTQQDLRGH